MKPDKILSPKRYLLAGVCMAVFATLAIYLPNEKVNEDQRDMYFGMPVSEASVAHDLFNDSGFNVKQLNGVKIVNPDTGKVTYYFEYIANKQDTLRRISVMPFLKDNRQSSLSCELMTSSLNPLDNSALTQEERDATSFFWNARAEDFIFYECYKSPVKHTLLLSKTSDLILHKVEFI